MIGRRTTRNLIFYVAALLALLPGAARAAQRVPGESEDLRITAVDTAAFPTVTVRVLTTGAGGAPVSDLSRLVLRENGVPIPDTTTAQTPVGVDLALVIDANADFLLFDDRSGLSRRDKTAASIARYAGQFMNPAGLDRVSIFAPDETGEGWRFLAQDTARPDEVAAAAEAYNPPAPRATPLQAMLAGALDHLAASDEGRFRAVLLYSDAARLATQLDYPELLAAAGAAGVPIYVAILGAEAAAEENDNAAGLAAPTNALTVHMPEPEAADSLYEIFRAQGQQAELAYESDVRENGTHEVSVSLGNVRDAAEYELSLAPPEVTIETPQTTVRRAGSAIDTPLALLQPAVLPLTVQVGWPDGHPRGLTEVIFRVDGTPQSLATEPALDGAGQLPLPWDISGRDTGVYRLEVEIVDALGFRATAAPVEIAVEVTRPSPPTPTVAPTRVPRTSPVAGVGGILWSTLAAVVLLAAAGAVVALRRRRRSKPGEETPMPRIIPATGPPPDDRHVAVLAWPDGGGEASDLIELTAADVTLGREPEAVDVVVDDPTVSRLHARIRRNAAGEYWLYDEGSVEGTFLNYERLGLAPRPLQHNDTIRLGRVTVRFRLELPGTTDDRRQTTDNG